MVKYLSLLICAFVFISTNVTAQTPNQHQPYSFQYYQKLNKAVYDTKSRFHSSIKNYFIDDSLLKPTHDSLKNLLVDTTKKNWIYRKLFNQHLIQIQKQDYSFYADFLPDFQIGNDSKTGGTWLNTRGFQVGGNIGSKFSFYTSGYENQASLPGYYQNFVNREGVIPGQVNDKFGPSRINKDWAYATALLSYTPVKYVNITLGQDKNFIGDGYRSVLLSDIATNYPFLKVTGNLGNVSYSATWAQLQDLKSPKLSYDNGFRKKWAVFHYLDWNVSNRLSLGFFDAIIWQDADETGKRGFDFSYINPLIFLRPVEGQNGSPDNALIGFTSKYELFNNLAIYGQFLLDEFTAKEFFSSSGYWANKWGLQFGVKGFDAFKIKNLNYLAEFNVARPFTYSQRSSLLNYGHYNQPLAHSLGANFKEFVSIWNYSFKRFDFQGQLNIAQYGLDQTPEVNNGKDIFKSYNTRVADYGNSIAQGLKTDFIYADAKIAYLINPKYNLRLELGAIARNEKNNQINDKNIWLTFGLRSSFRNLYTDF